MNPDLELALAMADLADAITMRHFRSTSLVVRTKIDMTPVSEADEEVERALRGHLASARPSDGILGEEFGVTGGSARRWILDPIDATKNYVRGIPVFATLIALEGIAGVVSAPALGRRWWAARGEGACCNGTRISVSGIATLEEAHLTYDSITDFDQHGGTDAFLALTRRCTRARGFGDFWAHMLVADGSIDIAVEVGGLAVWDIAAVKVVVEQAGGRCTDLRGDARIDTGDVISTNGLLHDDVVAAFRRA